MFTSQISSFLKGEKIDLHAYISQRGWLDISGVHHATDSALHHAFHNKDVSRALII